MRDFSSPPGEFGPLLHWIWNGDLRDEALRQGLEAMRANGVCEFVLQPHGDCTISYLSDPWFARVRSCVEQAQALGIKVWIGDDSALHSGTCNGRIPRENESVRIHHVHYRVEDISQTELARWQPPQLPGELLLVLAAPLDANRKPDFNSAVTVSNLPLRKAGQMLARKLNSDVRFYLFLATVSDDDIDMMNPEAVRLFVECTHSHYKLMLRTFVGSTVLGFYLNETAAHTGGTLDEGVYPWSPLLQLDFSIQPGYNLLEWLPALIANVGDDSARLRQDYWLSVSRLCRKGFWGPLCAWAESNKVSYAGVVQRSDSLNDMVARHGDLVPVLRTMGRPGVAAARGGAATPLNSDHGIHAKLCASVAALEGKPRALAELWSDCGWLTTIADRLLSLHKLLQQGINSFVTSRGLNVLPDRAQVENVTSEWHQPYWTEGKCFTEYIGRAGYILSQGQPGARVALYWPTRSIWSHYNPAGHRYTRWVEEDLCAASRLLDELHYDFLLLPEDDLVDGQLDGSTLRCGKARHAFELIVVPSITTIGWAAWRKFEEFIEAGGKVACLGLLPRWSEKGRDQDLENHVTKSTMVTIGALYDAYSNIEEPGTEIPQSVGYPVSRENDAGGRISCYQPRLTADPENALLLARRLLKDCYRPELETQSPQIVYTRRVLSPQEVEVPDDRETVLTPEESAESGYRGLRVEPRPEFEWDSAPPEDEPEAAARPAASSGEEAVGDAFLLPDERANPEERIWAPGGDVFFIVNAGEETQHINLQLRASTEGVPHLLDAWTGEIRRIPVWMPYSEEEGGGLSLSLDMVAGEAAMVWVRPLKPSPAERLLNVERATFEVESFDGSVASGYAMESGVPRIAVRLGGRLARVTGEAVKVPEPMLLPDTWQAGRNGPNLLIADEWKWQRGRHMAAPRFRFGGERWLPLTEWLGVPGSGRQMNPEAQGLVSFSTSFHVGESPRSIYLQFSALDAPHELFLNEELLQPCPPPYPATMSIGPDVVWYDVGHALNGNNSLVCIADFRPRYGLGLRRGSGRTTPALARLFGDFALTGDRALTADTSFELDTGSWHEQGLPFYSGSVTYTQWVNVPQSWNECRVFLELSRMRDVASVWMNGRGCGARVAAPYRYDVSRRVLRGASNELKIRVYNTAEAGMEGHLRQPLPSGLLGPARLVAYPVVHPMIETKTWQSPLPSTDPPISDPTASESPSSE